MTTETGMQPGAEGSAPPPGPKGRRSQWTPIVPVPSNAPPPKLRHQVRGEPERSFTYRDGNGALLGVVCRWTDSKGLPVQLARTWCEAEDGYFAWQWIQFPSLRPLYGLDRLSDRPAVPVLVVFSELAADLASMAFAQWVVVSWPGGTRKLEDVDWSPLRGRTVIVWPDHGAAPGEDGVTLLPRAKQAPVKAAEKIATILRGYQTVPFAVIDTGEPHEHADGWSMVEASSEMEQDDLARWVRNRIDPLPVFDGESAAAGSNGSGGGGDASAPSGGGSESGGDLPAIRWVEGKLPQIVDEAEAALLAADLGLYQRSGMVVRVVRRDTPTVRNYKRPPNSLGIVMVDAPFLVESMTRAALWQRYDGRKDTWRRTNAPEKVALTFLSRAGQWRLPRLRAVISAPTLRPDGSVLQQPGYDEATQTFFDPCGVEFPEVPVRPTREDALQALSKLRKAFSTFPFDRETDESVALSLALTALVRRSLPSAPLGALSAPVMGSGKTLLADLIAILATGTAAPAMKYAETDEEAAKTALAVLVEGDAVVLIDNIERPLQGDWLCTLLTSETYSQRMLGRTEMMKVPTTTLFLATGNQLVVAGDLRTRTLLCRLDPRVEKPEERAFTHDAREWFMAHRASLVVAGLTVMRAHIAAGSPGDVPPWGRFEHWSGMVRAALVWLGMMDPCGSLRALEEDDPDRQQHLQIMSAWLDAFGNTAKSAREALAVISDIAATSEEKRLGEALKDVSIGRQGTPDSKKLAAWLRKHAIRRAAGMQFVKADERDHVALWKVEKVD